MEEKERMIYASQATHPLSEPIWTKTLPRTTSAAGGLRLNLGLEIVLAHLAHFMLRLISLSMLIFSFANESLGRESGYQCAGSHYPGALIFSLLADEQR
jgi:hypothetical protein